MKYFVYFVVLTICLVSETRAEINCGDLKLPLEERIINSDWIFTGYPVEDKVVEKTKSGFTSTVKINVTKVYKGNPGKTTALYYKGIYMNSLQDEVCDPELERPFSPTKPKDKLEWLFFAQIKDGRPTTSIKLGNSGVVGPTIRELKIVKEKLKIK